jgi:hypothetical protein
MVVLAPTALAATVKIRVEGKTTTIFGATQPTVTADNALQALDAASFAGEFYYGKTTSSFGDYVSQIGKYAADQSTGWVFKVNGISSQVGADKAVLKSGDVVLWYHTPSGDRRSLDARAEGFRPAATSSVAQRCGRPCRAAGRRSRPTGSGSRRRRVGPASGST